MPLGLIPVTRINRFGLAHRVGLRFNGSNNKPVVLNGYTYQPGRLKTGFTNTVT